METDRNWRILNRNGTFNIKRLGGNKSRGADFYHQLLSISWPKFLLLVIAPYFLINLIFAFLYFSCGPKGLTGVPLHANPSFYFLDCFFFSIQTFATIGYGRVGPSGLASNLIVTLEALVGLFSLALTTGLIFARFSKPTAKIMFSNSAVITSENGKRFLIFRLANQRLNQIVDAHVSVVLIKSAYDEHGRHYRKLHELKLERSHSPILVMTWTIAHPIDEHSPILNLSKEDLKASEAEILVSLTGIDDIFSQTLHAHFSYVPDDLRWDAHFEDMLSRNKDGVIEVQMDKLHSVTPT